MYDFLGHPVLTTRLEWAAATDHDVGEWDASVGVGVDAAVDGLDERGTRRRHARPDDVEQVADDQLAVAAAVEERAQLVERVVAQQHAEVDECPLQRLTRHLPRRPAPALHLPDSTAAAVDYW